ncbi:ADC synthase [Chytriomyces sp. MP71]|nr:ADC synthase [Chytriomyces sp. MP71]
MRVLIIDNYDSYTFNLLQTVRNASPVVIRNDQFEWDHFRSQILPFFDCVIISPGPGRPDKKEASTLATFEGANDFGLCLDLLCNAQSIPIPVFGVCLGHQGIGAAFGAHVVHAEEPFHGRLSRVTHTGHGLMEGIPQRFEVVRYHSLVVDPTSLPDHLQTIGWTESSKTGGQDIIMALKHKTLPLWGVQFHPESICTEFGVKLVDNFMNLAKAFWKTIDPSWQPKTDIADSIRAFTVIPMPLLNHAMITSASHPQLFKRVKAAHLLKLDISFDRRGNYAEQVFETCFCADNVPARFWLDSARVECGLSRWSYMGACSSTESYLLAYSTATRTVNISTLDSKKGGLQQSVMRLSAPDDTFFHFMARAADEHGFWGNASPVPQHVQLSHPGSFESSSLPEFIGGYAGYFGYEMKCESMTMLAGSSGFKTKSANTTPDSLYLFADRLVALDHATGSVWLVSLEFADTVGAESARVKWVQEMQRVIGGIQESAAEVPVVTSSAAVNNSSSTPGFQLRHDREQYIANVEASLANIREGETYEVCLTTKIGVTVPLAGAPGTYDVYKRIRARNPAPYGAFIQVPHLGLSVMQSSPERFLRSDGARVVEMKPIKGTVARPPKEGDFMDHATWLREDNARKDALENNEKDRAENLMIVDLIRNDLNLISVPNSVHVPFLMHVESYATVHQLVSTIRCTLKPGLTPLDAVRSSFPPGSMTGAPKLRTCQILEELEKGSRGLYSGCLGFLSAVGGVVDLSVVIRTAVVVEDVADGNARVEIGAGGAIVFLSDPSGEFEEMLLKANSVMPSLKDAYAVS